MKRRFAVGAGLCLLLAACPGGDGNAPARSGGSGGSAAPPAVVESTPGPQPDGAAPPKETGSPPTPKDAAVQVSSSDASAGPVDALTSSSSPDVAAPAPAEAPGFLYVGSGFFSNGVTPAVHAFRFDPKGPTAQPVGKTETPPWPTFAVFDPKRPRLFVTIENDPGKVAAFSLDTKTGALSPLGSPVPSGGNGSTHIAIDRTGRTLFESHFGSGAVTTLRVGDDGAPGAVVATQSWPVLMGTVGRIHSVAVHPGNRFVYAAGFWYDEIEQLLLDEATGMLTPNEVPAAAAEPGAGPRVIEVAPNGRFAYVVNQGSGRGGKPAPRTVSVYAIDQMKGTLTRIQDIATGVTTGYQYHLQLAPGGRFLYVSAGASLVAFAIDATTGKLNLTGTYATGGKTPRHFSIAPSGRFAFCANLDSDTVTLFTVDPATGALSPTGSPLAVPHPTWVGLYAAP